MAGRMVTHCPSPLVQSPLLDSLLQCAALGMTLHHRDANRGTLNFLESTVSYSLKLQSNVASGSSLDDNERADVAALERAILHEGRPLVTNLAQALLGDLPAYRLDSGNGSIAGGAFLPELAMSRAADAVDTAAIDIGARARQKRVPSDVAQPRGKGGFQLVGKEIHSGI